MKDLFQFNIQILIKQQYLIKSFLGKKGFKYFIGYKDVKKIYIPLCIFLPKMNSYKRVFDETKYMSFFDKK